MKRTIFISLLILTISCGQEQSKIDAKENISTTEPDSKDTKTKDDHQHDSANEHMNHHSTFDELVNNFEGVSRAEWQKPDQLIASFGDIKGKRIMDIGCGTGYFAFRMADKGAEVICADIDDRFLKYVNQKKAENNTSDKLLHTLKTEENSPSLGTKVIDKALIVNTYHHIEDRVGYFNELKQSLLPQGEVIVVDFKKNAVMDFGPPKSMRLAKEVVIAEMTKAGYPSYTLDETLLPYQYILRFSHE